MKAIGRLRESKTLLTGIQIWKIFIVLMKRLRITEHIEYLRPENEIGRFLCSGMIVRGSGKVFFDTNFGEVKTKELLLSEKPDFAIISHYHLDHALWGGFVRSVSDAELFVPFGEEDYVAKPDFFFERTVGRMPSAELWKQFVLEHLKFKGVREFRTYDGSFSLDLKQTKMVFVPAPGHSPGHMTAYFPEENILFTSDLGFGLFGPWYGFKDCDICYYVESLLTLKAMKPKLLLTGHGGVICEDIEGIFDRSIEVFFLREDRIREGLEKGRSRDSIVEDGIYFKNKEKAKGPLKGFLGDWDAVMFDLHIGVLNKGGLDSFFPGTRRRSQFRPTKS
jgi:glyoxylase-like metal-dependent hydrolase (beta-lactamase superfamily II)